MEISRSTSGVHSNTRFQRGKVKHFSGTVARECPLLAPEAKSSAPRRHLRPADLSMAERIDHSRQMLTVCRAVR